MDTDGKLRRIFTANNNFPAPGSVEESRVFTEMQVQLKDQFEKIISTFTWQ